MQALWVLAGICSISAMLLNIDESSLKMVQNEKCQICHGSDCLSIDENRCEYYRHAGNILLEKPEANTVLERKITTEIDNILIDYTQKSSLIYTDCMPLVSQYTNCNRENVCVGCQTCYCNIDGQWNCTMTQRCQPNTILDVNHRTLVVVMEKLKEYENKFSNKREKMKRSIYDSETEKERINNEEVLQLLYGLEYFEHRDKSIPMENIIVGGDTNKHVIGHPNGLNTEVPKFDDLLNSIINNRSFIYNLNEFVLSQKNSTITETNKTLNNDIFSLKSVEVPTVDHLNFHGNDIRNLKKRDTLFEHKYINLSLTSNSSANIRYLKDGVLNPLFDIINDKQKELKQLIDIKEKLLLYIKSFNDVNFNNVTNSSQNSNESYVRFYQFETPTEINYELLRLNPNYADKYLEKLKNDILLVIQDIESVQRLSGSSTIPHDLKLLKQVMKYYIDKEYQMNEREIPITVNLRRKFLIDSNLTQVHPTKVICKIFEILDKNIPLTHSLDQVSMRANVILKRIVKQFYMDDLVPMNIQVHNITNQLKNIGYRWNKINQDLVRIPISEHLYYIKLLHLELSTDIDKIKNARKLLEFTHHRRMTIIEDSVGEGILSKIGHDLQRINRRVKQILQLRSLNRYVEKNKSKVSKNTLQPPVLEKLKNTRKRKSFLQNIKRLLSNSKKDIRDLFHKKIPNSEIIKRIVRKNNDEVTKKKLLDYEDAMHRWQNNLNIVSIRHKRAAGEFQKFLNRVKNIIPAYLRRKVKPAVDKKINNKTRTNNSHRSRQDGKNKKKKRISRSTPKIRESTHMQRNSSKLP